MRGVLLGVLLTGCGEGFKALSEQLPEDVLTWGRPDVVCVVPEGARCWESWLADDEAAGDEEGWCSDREGTYTTDAYCPDDDRVGECEFSVYEGYRTLSFYYADPGEVSYTEASAREHCEEIEHGEFTATEAE